MFKTARVYNVLRSSGAKCMVRRTNLHVHCELERQTGAGGEVYKHLAPLEPEQFEPASLEHKK